MCFSRNEGKEHGFCPSGQKPKSLRIPNQENRDSAASVPTHESPLIDDEVRGANLGWRTALLNRLQIEAVGTRWKLIQLNFQCDGDHRVPFWMNPVVSMPPAALLCSIWLMCCGTRGASSYMYQIRG